MNIRCCCGALATGDGAARAVVTICLHRLFAHGTWLSREVALPVFPRKDDILLLDGECLRVGHIYFAVGRVPGEPVPMTAEVEVFASMDAAAEQAARRVGWRPSTPPWA